MSNWQELLSVLAKAIEDGRTVKLTVEELAVDGAEVKMTNAEIVVE